MKKRIVFMIISLVLMSSFVSAGFLDWFLGGNNDLKDVTGMQTARTSQANIAKAQADARGSVLKFGTSPMSGVRATLTSSKDLRVGSASLSLVSSSGGQATLRYESTVTVKDGQVIELNGQQFTVLLSAATTSNSNTQSGESEPGETSPGRCTQAPEGGNDECTDELVSNPGTSLVTLVKTTSSSNTQGGGSEPGETSPGRCTQAPEGGNDECTDELVAASGVALRGNLNVNTKTSASQTVTSTTSSGLFTSLRNLFR